EARELIDRRLLVLVDVHDHMRRSQFANRFEVHALGAADLRYRPDLILRMDAEAGAADQAIPGAEFEQQFGDAGYEADDAGIGPGQRMRTSDGIDCAGRDRIHFLTATIRERIENHASAITLCASA